MKDFIVVAGGAGFIGVNLCMRLMDLGHNILILDDLSSGTDTNINILIKYARDASKELIYEHQDISSHIYIENQIEARIAAIFNLACPASPPFYQKNPIHTIKTCIDGTFNLANLAESCNCPMLLTSTSEVYGDPTISPQSENYRGNVNCYGPRACYDEGKRLAETIMFEYNRRHPGKYKVARIFNTYGPGMRADDGRFISNFIMQALNDEPLTIYGNGSQTRSICYVDDTVNGLIDLMYSREVGPINIGNPTEMPVVLWAKYIWEAVHEYDKGKELKLIYKQLPTDDPLQRRPDISKANALLNWSPKVDYSAGLDKTINYFRYIDEY